MLINKGGWGVDPISLTLQKMIERNIEKVTPGERQVMTSVASVDMVNYLMIKLGIEDHEEAEEMVRGYAVKMIEESPAEFLSITGEWFDIWLWKWRQRVRLVLGKEKEEHETTIDQRVKPIIPMIKHYKELFRYTVSSLIRNNEVCFTNLLAENLIKSSLYKMSLSVDHPPKLAKMINKNPVFLLEDISKRVKNLKRFKGQLVVVRVNPQIFSQHTIPRIIRMWWF